MLTYTTGGSLTQTLASLASAGSARECTVVSNTANRYDDVQVNYTFTMQTGTAPGGDKSIYIYFYSASSGTDYTNNATGTDAAITVSQPNNFFGPAVVTTQSSASAAGANIYNMTIPSVATFFSGIMPQQWGTIVQNSTGMLFSAAEGSHIKAFVGIVFSTS